MRTELSPLYQYFICSFSPLLAYKCSVEFSRSSVTCDAVIALMTDGVSVYILVYNIFQFLNFNLFFFGKTVPKKMGS